MRRGMITLLVALSATAFPSCKPNDGTYTDPVTGEQVPVPDRIRIETETAPGGIVWVEGELYRTSADGPFAAFATKGATEPDYWYYRSVGIVPVGAPARPASEAPG